MSMSQYDISKPTDYLSRKMFLDVAGPVTMQRFDKVKYNKLQKFEEVQRGFFWVPEEIDTTKDRQDMKGASDAIRHMFTSNLLRQTTLDSLQGKAPAQVFCPVVSIPELEALMYIWSAFETNIHSKSYSHIIRGVYSMSSEVFDQVHDNQEIVEMAAHVGRYYDKLHRLNCMVELGMDVDPREHKKAIWLALHASYALEAIRFMVSFATSLAMMEHKIFIGNGTIIGLILQDELLHTEWTAWIINQAIKEDEDFRSIRDELQEEVYALYMEVIQEEKNWARYLCKEGSIIGLNERILCQFVDFTAKERLAAVGISYTTEDMPKSHPIPWFLKHVNQETKQTALQELESTDYVIGVLGDELNVDELPEV